MMIKKLASNLAFLLTTLLITTSCDQKLTFEGQDPIKDLITISAVTGIKSTTGKGTLDEPLTFILEQNSKGILQIKLHERIPKKEDLSCINLSRWMHFDQNSLTIELTPNTEVGATDHRFICQVNTVLQAENGHQIFLKIELPVENQPPVLALEFHKGLAQFSGNGDHFFPYHIEAFGSKEAFLTLKPSDRENQENVSVVCHGLPQWISLDKKIGKISFLPLESSVNSVINFRCSAYDGAKYSDDLYFKLSVIPSQNTDQNLEKEKYKLVILGGNEQTTFPNTPFAHPIKTQLIGPDGNIVDATIRYILESELATIEKSEQKTDIDGISSMSVAAGAKSGRVKITVSWEELSVDFQLLVTTKKTLSLISGTDQEGYLDSPFPQSLKVQLSSPDGGVGDETIIFSTESGDGTLTNTTVITNDAGIAETYYTGGSKAGVVKIRASWEDQIIIFHLKTVSKSTLTAIGGDGQKVNIHKEFSSPLQVMLFNDSGGISNETITFTVIEGSGSISLQEVSTDSKGRGETRIIAGSLVEAIKVKASWKDQSVFFNLEAQAPKELTILQGSGQTALIHQEFSVPLTVKLTEQNNPLPGETISFSIISGSALIQTPQAITDEKGAAQIKLKAGAIAGQVEIQAKWLEKSVIFALTVSPEPEKNLSIVSGNSQFIAPNAPASKALLVQLTGSNGGIANEDIIYSIESGGGNLSSVTATTDPSGYASTDYTAGTETGIIKITASWHQYSVVFIIDVKEPPAANIAILAGDHQSTQVSSSVPDNLSIILTHPDTQQPRQGIAIRFRTLLGGGLINGEPSVDLLTNADGIASASFQLGVLAGENKVEAAVIANKTIKTIFTLTGLPEAPSASQSVITTDPESLPADGVSLSTITLVLKDQFGNLTPNAPPKSVVFSSDVGTLVGVVTNNGNGTYSQLIRASSTIPSTGFASIGATLEAIPIQAAGKGKITLLPGTLSLADSIVASESEELTVGEEEYTRITVSLRDKFQNKVVLENQDITLSTTLGTFEGDIVDNGDGTYTTLFHQGTVAGTAIISATAGGAAISGTATITINPGAPDPGKCSLKVTPHLIEPDGISTATTTLTIKDQYDNPIIGADDTEITTTGGSMIGSVINHGDGTYSKIIRSGIIQQTATLQAAAMGITCPMTALVQMLPASLAPSPIHSSITIADSSIAANGQSQTTVTITLRNSLNELFTTGGSQVTLSTTSGTVLNTMTDHGDGTYSQKIQSGESPIANVIISATVDGQSLLRTVSISFFGPLNTSQSTISAQPSSIEADGVSTSVINIIAKDINGVTIPIGGEIIGNEGLRLMTTSGTLLGDLVDNNNGIYSQILQATQIASTTTLTATLNGSPFTDNKEVLFYEAFNLAGKTIDCSNVDVPDAVLAGKTIKGGPIIVDGGTLIINTRGPNGTCPDDMVFTQVILKNYGTITHSATGSLTTNTYGMEIIADSVYIDASSQINIDGKGHMPTNNYFFMKPKGMDGAEQYQTSNSGGPPSHGGMGGSQDGSDTSNWMPTYGSLFEPNLLGAGSSANNNANAGGGRVKLTVLGTITLDGKISANGEIPAHQTHGTGAGGSVWIDTHTLEGIGQISANGSSFNSIGGGGGRIAIYYEKTSNHFSYPNNIITNVTAFGASSESGDGSGAPGTIYLKDKINQTYGDLIIRADAVTNEVQTIISGPIASPATSVSPTSIEKTNLFSDFSETFIYKGYYLIPNLFENSTSNVLDNSYFKIINGNNNSIDIENGNDITSLHQNVGTDQFTLALIFDNIEISGNVQVASEIPIIGLKGDLNSNDEVTAYIDGIPPKRIEFALDSIVTIDATNLGNLPQLLVNHWNDIKFLGKNSSLTIGSTFYAKNVIFDQYDIISNMNRTNLLFDLTGNLTLRNHTHLTQTQTSTTPGGPEKSIEIRATGLSIDATSSISATDKGYHASSAIFTCRTVGNINLTAGDRYSTNQISQTSGSHGGLAAINSSSAGSITTYGNLFDPYWSGSSCNNDNSAGVAGGGIIRIDLGDGNALIDGHLSADAGDDNEMWDKHGGEAGGSIKLEGGHISGSGTISAKGGNSWSGGGGGRIAIYYKTLAGNFTPPTKNLAAIQAYGGYSDNPALQGGPGTIYLKNKDSLYGDLIINNNDLTLTTGGDYVNAGRGALLKLPGGLVSTSLTATTLTFSGSLIDSAGVITNHLKGFYLSPKRLQNGTEYFSDDTLFPIVSHTDDTITIASGDLTSIATVGDTFDVIAIFRQVQVTGNGVLRIEGGGGIIVTEGDPTSLAGTFIMPAGSGVEGNGWMDFSLLSDVTLNGFLIKPYLDGVQQAYFNNSSGIDLINFNATEAFFSNTSGTWTDSQFVNNVTIDSGSDIQILGNTTFNQHLSIIDSSVTGNLNISGNLTISNGVISSESIEVIGHTTISDNSVLQAPDIDTSANNYGLTLSTTDFSLSYGSTIDLSSRGPSEPTVDKFLRVPGISGMQNIATVSGHRVGGSHGGQGGRHSASYTNLNTYGNLFEPIEVGSSGYRHDNNNRGTAGGGRIKLSATGATTINGNIIADGEDSTDARRFCGAGGSIWLDVNTIAGSGTISARGGDCTNPNETAGGGGGRIALYYNESSEGFAYGNLLVNRLDASGGFGGGSDPGISMRNGAAGTIYLKDKDDQLYGDLLIDNKGKLSVDAKTPIHTPNPSIADGVTTSTLTRSGHFSDYYTGRFPYRGYFLLPRVDENNTPQAVDDSRFLITSGNDDTITTATSGIDSLHANVGTDQFHFGLFFDRIEIRGEARVDTFGMPLVAVTGGDVSSGSNNIAVLQGGIPETIEFVEQIDVTLDIVNGNSLSSLTTVGWYNLTIIGGGKNLTLDDTFSAHSLTLDDFIIYSNTSRQNKLLNLSGSLTLRNGGKIQQNATSSTPNEPEKSVEITASSLHIDASSSIIADGSGYIETTNYRCRVNGNRQIIYNHGKTDRVYAGASHGGFGGAWSTNFGHNKTYGNLFDPYWSGASCRHNSSYAGGGIIRIDLENGNAVIDGLISANGSNVTVSSDSRYSGPAGGSIKLIAGAISGTGYISAIGGNGSNAGGGGRIAIYYDTFSGAFETPSNRLMNIRAWGGQTSYQDTRNGHAGTIFLKAKSDSYGDLIINNNGATISTNAQAYGIGTPLNLPGNFATQSPFNASTANTSLDLTENGDLTNHLVGFFLNPNTEQNATPQFTDDQLFAITGQTETGLTTDTDLTTIATIGDNASIVAYFRKLHITGNSVLNLGNSGTVIVAEGDPSSSPGNFTMSSDSKIEGDSSSILDFSLLDSVSIANPNDVQSILKNDANLTITEGSGFIVTNSSLASLTLNQTIATINNTELSGGLTLINSAQANLTGTSTIGGNVSIASNSNLTVTEASISGNLTIDNASLTAGSVNKTAKALNVTGDMTLTNASTLWSTAASPTLGGPEYYLSIKASDILIDATSKISAAGKGYNASTNTNDYARSIGNQQYATGRTPSHGGHGGTYSTHTPTYGNFTKPRELGSSSRRSGKTCGQGGGSIYIESSDLQVDGIITVDGLSGSYCGGAGGSILIETTSIRGFGNLSATGGFDTGSTNYYGAGGGRIAVYFINSFDNFSYPSNITDHISAAGGITEGNLTRAGAAGTVYLFKTGSSQYGDLYVDNANRAASVFTDLSWYTTGTNSSLSATRLDIASNSFGYDINANHNYDLDNRYMGFCINPNTNENATDTITDDALFKITESYDNYLTVLGDMTAVASTADPFRVVLCLDNLTVSRKAHLKVGSGDIYVSDGDIKTGDFTLDGSVTANVIDVGTSATWTTTANANANVNKKCDTAGCSPP